MFTLTERRLLPLYQSNLLLLLVSQAVDAFTTIQAVTQGGYSIKNGEFPLIYYGYEYFGLLGVPFAKLLAVGLIYLISEKMRKTGGIKAATWGLQAVNVITTFAALTNEMGSLHLF